MLLYNSECAIFGGGTTDGATTADGTTAADGAVKGYSILPVAVVSMITVIATMF